MKDQERDSQDVLEFLSDVVDHFKVTCAIQSLLTDSCTLAFPLHEAAKYILSVFLIIWTFLPILLCQSHDC